MASVFRRLRTSFAELAGSSRRPKPRGERAAPAKRRPYNLFEAAAAHICACAEDDEDGIEESASWVSPEALTFGVRELACRAVLALAREREQSPRTVARALLGLPAA
jgi:hypothetical protein